MLSKKNYLFFREIHCTALFARSCLIGLGVDCVVFCTTRFTCIRCVPAIFTHPYELTKCFLFYPSVDKMVSANSIWMLTVRCKNLTGRLPMKLAFYIHWHNQIIADVELFAFRFVFTWIKVICKTKFKFWDTNQQAKFE